MATVNNEGKNMENVFAEVDQLNGYQIARFQRGETLPFVKVGRDEWFENANKLFLQAEKKYSLRKRVADYMAEKYPDKQPHMIL